MTEGHHIQEEMARTGLPVGALSLVKGGWGHWDGVPIMPRCLSAGVPSGSIIASRQIYRSSEGMALNLSMQNCSFQLVGFGQAA